MEIIEYEQTYKENVVNLLIEVAVKEYGFTDWEKWFREFENEKYRLNNGNCWIVLDNEKVVGTISLKNIDNITGEIKNLYVDKEYRGRGIAKKLLDLLTNFAKDKGYRRLQLDSYDEFKIAIKFYEKNQFVLEKSLQNKYIFSKMLYQEMISIIVPIYNIEQYLESCIESIISQTYKNMQIILVDDGSTDKSGEICDKYKAKDDRIQVIHKENAGLADARNTGLKLAKGKYISFVDGDDYLFPTFYEDLYYIIETYDTDIAECGFLRIKEDQIKEAEEIINEYNKKIQINQEIDNNKTALNKLYGTELNPYVKKVVVWNKLYKKDLFDEITFPIGKLHEDEYTTYKIIDKCEKVVSTNKVLHGYIQTNNSIMRKTIKQKRIDDNLDAYIKCSEHFAKKGDIELEGKCRRRYLENCIELAGKVLKSDNEDKKQQIDMIQSLFIEFYDKYIKKIMKNSIDNREVRIMEEVIVQAYNDLKEFNKCIGDYWGILEKIINE